MPYIQTGSCTRCGSPKWSPEPQWWNEKETPPPTYSTCSCFNNNDLKRKENLDQPKKSYNDFEELIENHTKILEILTKEHFELARKINTLYQFTKQTTMDIIKSSEKLSYYDDIKNTHYNEKQKDNLLKAAEKLEIKTNNLYKAANEIDSIFKSEKSSAAPDPDDFKGILKDKRTLLKD